jgi:hypothetical protein
MVTKEVVTARYNLEKQILALLVNFTEQAGLIVTDVDIQLLETTRYTDELNGHGTYVYQAVKVTAKL